jgi:hypothetical protein
MDRDTPTRAPVAMLAALVATSVASCRDLLGIERREEVPEGTQDVSASSSTSAATTVAGGGTGGAGGGAADPLLPGACGTCAAQECASAVPPCEADASCRALVGCMLERPDDPIGRVACLDDDPATADQTPFVEVDACLRDACLDACYVGGRGFYAAYPQECRTCLDAGIQGPLDACVADPACERAMVFAFADPAAVSPVRTQALSAIGAEGAEERDLATAIGGCASACGAGAYFDCVSGYAWPTAPPGGDIEVEIQAPIAVDGTFVPVPVQGIELAACYPFADACETRGVMTTDVDGVARGRVSLPGGAGGFRGHFRASRDQSVVPLFPGLFFPGRPLGAPIRMGTVLLSVDAAEEAAQLVGGLDPDRAFLALTVLDCVQFAAPGMTLEVPPAFLEGGGEIVYPGAPDVEGPTGVNGVIGVLNANPGCVEVRVLDARGVETHRTRLIAEAGAATHAGLLPLTENVDLVFACDEVDFPLDD